jgi:murein biosynthesis integral membrane protein MurJ
MLSVKENSKFYIVGLDISNKLIKKIWNSATQRVISLTFIGMLIGLTVDILIAAKLGTGKIADALIIALSLPLFVDTISREGTKFSMVPIFMERRAILSEDEYNRFVSGLTNFALMIGLIILFFIEMLASWVVNLLAPGLTEEGKTEAAKLLMICSPLVLFAMGITILSTLLNSQKRFSIVALRNAIAPGVVVLTIGLMWNRENITLWIAAAHAIGFAGFFFLLFWGARRVGYRHLWSAWPSMKDISNLLSIISFPTIGFIVGQSLRMIERLLASLFSIGGVASYYFAFGIFSAIQTLIGYSIAITVLPTLTDQNLRGENTKIAVTIRKKLLKTLWLSLPVGLCIFFFNEEIIRLVYGHGSFDETSINQTSNILFWFSLGIIFICFIPILISGLYAKKAYKLILQNMITIAAINILLAWIFSQAWGLVGIAIAVSFSALLGVVNLLYLLHKTGIFLIKKNYKETL